MMAAEEEELIKIDPWEPPLSRNSQDQASEVERELAMETMTRGTILSVQRMRPRTKPWRYPKFGGRTKRVQLCDGNDEMSAVLTQGRSREDMAAVRNKFDCKFDIAEVIHLREL